MVEQCLTTVILTSFRDDIVVVCCNSFQVILALAAIVLVILGRRRLLHLVIFVVMLQAIVLIFLSAMMVRSLSIPLTQTEGDIKEEINKQLYQTLRLGYFFQLPNDLNNFDSMTTHMDTDMNDYFFWSSYMTNHRCCGVNGHSDFQIDLRIPSQCQCYCRNITVYEPPSNVLMDMSDIAGSIEFKKAQQPAEVVLKCTQNRGGHCKPEQTPNINISLVKGQPGCFQRIAREYHELFSFVEHVKAIVVTSVAWLHLLLALVHFCIHHNPQ